MNMSTREFVMVVHTFPVDNGFVADKHAIQTAYRKHPTQNSMRCVSDVLDEIGVNHEVCSLESCSDVDLDGKILFVPYELNPLRFVSGHCMDTLTLYDGKVKTDVPLRKIETHLPLYVIQTDGHALDKKARCNVGCYFRNVIWDLGDNGLKALMFVFLLALIFINPIYVCFAVLLFLHPLSLMNFSGPMTVKDCVTLSGRVDAGLLQTMLIPVCSDRFLLGIWH